jgi:uncharacterized protein (TIGR03083 family)
MTDGTTEEEPGAQEPDRAHDHIVEVLVDEWTIIAGLLARLGEQDWATLTDLPGWDVRDNVSHIIGTESMLAGDPQPDAPPDLAEREHVLNEIGAANEAWVHALRGTDTDEMVRRFLEVTGRRAQQLRAMTAEDFGAPSWTPVGNATYARFMQVRIFDCWMHEQDIRRAVGMPGNEDGPAAVESLEEVVRALGFVVGKRAGAPDGSAVTISLDGPLRRDLHVEVRGRAAVVERLERPADAAIRMDSNTFMRLAGGRVEARTVLDHIHLDGDIELASQVVGHLGFTI